MTTTFLKVKNNAISSLAAGISDSDTTLVVATGEGNLFPSTYPFHITIDSEIVSCTNRSSDTLTITRAQEATVANAHSEDAVVSLNVTAQHISDLNTAVNNLEGAIPSGVIVMWSGTLASIPSGWYLCDGNNGTPNLVAKFIQGIATSSTNPGSTGGATSKTTSGHTHLISFITKHPGTETSSIYCGSSNSQASVSSTDTITDIRPTYYELAFIMKA